MRKIALVVCLAFAGEVTAHGLDVLPAIADGRIIVRVLFDDGSAAAGSKVELVVDGRVVLSGRTDLAGNWSAPLPGDGVYQLQADAGAGHLASRQLDIADGRLRAVTGGRLPVRRVWAVLLGLGILAFVAVAARAAMKRPLTP